MSTAPAHPLGSVLIDRSRIASRVAELAGEVNAVYAKVEQPLVLICVLKGSLIFTADLCRALAVPVDFDFVACRSYGGEPTSSGHVELVKDVGMGLLDRDVLVVEDIIDTGLTTSFLLDHLSGQRPRSLRLISLLAKSGRRVKDVHIDFRGFDIPDRFVVGYGLDIAEHHRNLRDIRLLQGA